LLFNLEKSQKDYLLKLEAKQSKGKSKGDSFSVDYGSGSDEVPISVSFNSNQMNAVVHAEDAVSQKEKEVRQIAQSINDLALIFKDLSILVTEQGTLLDRIDFNIETTKVTMESAVKEVKKAQDHQKSYKKKLCMLLLCLIILILLIVIVIRFFM